MHVAPYSRAPTASSSGRLYGQFRAVFGSVDVNGGARHRQRLDRLRMTLQDRFRACLSAESGKLGEITLRKQARRTVYAVELCGDDALRSTRVCGDQRSEFVATDQRLIRQCDDRRIAFAHR